MTDKPQLMTEEIELIPHPMDAWRAALDAVIACAPGDSAAIAVHLAEARQQALVFVDRTTATEGTRKLVDRLMLIGAGRIVGDRLQAQAAPATVAAINRRVTARLTVVVNGTDYDVSGMPGVMVGDMIRVDPNNMPPVLNQDALGLGFEQQKVHLLAAATRANGKCLLTPDGAAARLSRSASDTAFSVAQDAQPIHPGTGLESPVRSAQPLSASQQSQAQPSQGSPVAEPASDLPAPETGHSSIRPVDPACAEAQLLQPQPHGGFVPKPDSQ